MFSSSRYSGAYMRIDGTVSGEVVGAYMVEQYDEVDVAVIAGFAARGCPVCR